MSVPRSKEQYWLDKLDEMKKHANLPVKICYIHKSGKVEHQEINTNEVI